MPVRAKISREVIEKIGKSLRELPSKADEGAVNLSAAIAMLKADIVQARANDYSFAEIVEHMRKNGLIVSTSSLKAGVRAKRLGKKSATIRAALKSPSNKSQTAEFAAANTMSESPASTSKLTSAASRRNER